MRIEEELKVLYAKFDRDEKKYSRIYRLLLATEQWFNVLLFNGSMDETISSKLGRKEKLNWFEKKLCCLLSKLEYNHCYKSLGE